MISDEDYAIIDQMVRTQMDYRLSLARLRLEQEKNDIRRQAEQRQSQSLNFQIEKFRESPAKIASKKEREINLTTLKSEQPNIAEPETADTPVINSPENSIASTRLNVEKTPDPDTQDTSQNGGSHETAANEQTDHVDINDFLHLRTPIMPANPCQKISDT